MPAPKNPNTADANRASAAARTRRKHERWAEELAAAGWTTVPPGRSAEKLGIDQMGDDGHDDAGPWTTAEMSHFRGPDRGPDRGPPRDRLTGS